MTTTTTTGSPQFQRRADKEQQRSRSHSSYVCHVVQQADIPALPAAVVKQPERGGRGGPQGSGLYIQMGGGGEVSQNSSI